MQERCGDPSPSLAILSFGVLAAVACVSPVAAHGERGGMLSGDKIVLAGMPPSRSGDATAADAPAFGEPSTPALRALQGRVPLVYLVRGPWSGQRPHDPAYEVVVFDDGTVVYEGHRCVREGGMALRRLDAAVIDELRALLDEGCVDFHQPPADELCAGEKTLAITCVRRGDVLAGNDRCQDRRDSGAALRALVAQLEERIGVAAWLGAPTERQACAPGAADLAPGEITRTVGPLLRASRRIFPRS
jgi:hypothetical protein